MGWGIREEWGRGESPPHQARLGKLPSAKGIDISAIVWYKRICRMEGDDGLSLARLPAQFRYIPTLYRNASE